MAIDEETFYTITGEEINRSNLVNQMIALYALKIEVGETRVTDFNEGSEIRNLLEAIAVPVYFMMEDDNELAKIAFVETAEGEWLDKHGANPFIKLARDTGTQASGYVTFTIPSAGTDDIVIPEGTVIVSTENGLDYATNSEYIISAGETSVVASVTCLSTGEDGNCSANTITMIDDDYLDLDELSVNNTEAFTGGTDYEEDDEYRERLLAYAQKDDFGSLPYYTELGNNVPGVHDVYLVDATGYTKKVLVNGNTKPTPESVLADVLEAYTHVENHILDQTFTVDTPDYVTLDLKASLEVIEELDSDDVKAVIKDVIDGGASMEGIGYDGLSIGETLTVNSLVTAVELFDGVESVTFYDSNDDELTDVSVDPDEVIKAGTITVVQSVVS